MLAFPCAKINLGLNVISERIDGLHDIETVFYPIPLTDALEIKYMAEEFPCEEDCDLKVSGPFKCPDDETNLVIKAYKLLSNDYSMPRVHAHLFKRIPSQAGLGGGSSDGAFMIRLLDERFRLNIGIAEMERYAAILGADCAFFISAEPCFATGIGNELSPADGPQGNLSGYYIAVVKPDIAVSTGEAYQLIEPKKPEKSCKMIVRQPIETWKDELVNDFEKPVFARHPEIGNIKARLYELGASFAQMSGSGSAVYGIFKKEPVGIDDAFKGCFTFTSKL